MTEKPARKPDASASKPPAPLGRAGREKSAPTPHKPADGKLPLPPRYGDKPTTGEVLYEYIRASEKLRAAAILHIFDAWLQMTAKVAKDDVSCLAMKTAERKAEGLQLNAEALARARDEALDAAHGAKEQADAFRNEMRECFGPFPFQFLGAMPCLLNGGFTFAAAPAHCPSTAADLKLPDGRDLIDGLPFFDMLAALTTEHAKHYEFDLSDALRGAFDFVLLPTVDESLKAALSDALKATGNAALSKEDAERLGVVSLVKDDAPRKGRPAAFLNDLWRWQVWAACKGKIWDVFERPADIQTSGLPCSPKEKGGGQVYYYDRKKHATAAERAEDRIKELEAACPDVPVKAWNRAALIGIRCKKMADKSKADVFRGDDRKQFEAVFERFHKEIAGKDGDAVLTRVFHK
jgi:hypothetical protein